MKTIQNPEFMNSENQLKLALTAESLLYYNEIPRSAPLPFRTASEWIILNPNIRR